MKFFKLCKDGGPESKVWGYFLCEIKSLFSVVLLRFEDGTRPAWHSHAFNAYSWVLKGEGLTEYLDDGSHNVYKPSLSMIRTPRECFHQVKSKGTTWVLSFRGPWVDQWREFSDGRDKVLTHGRKEVVIH